MTAKLSKLNQSVEKVLQIIEIMAKERQSMRLQDLAAACALLKKAGITENITLHGLRHTFATLAIQNGVDAKTVSNILGHYSAGFTLDTYTHVTSEMQKDAAQKVGSFMAQTV